MPFAQEDDIIALIDKPDRIGMVQSTYATDPLVVKRRLQRNAFEYLTDNNISAQQAARFASDGRLTKELVLVEWEYGPPELVYTSQLIILARAFNVGDIVKARAEDTMSGVVLDTSDIYTLQPLVPVEVNPGSYFPFSSLQTWNTPTTAAPLMNVPASELTYHTEYFEGMLVCYDDWVGQITNIHNALHLRLSNDTVVEVDEDLAHEVEDSGKAVGDVVSTPKGDLRRGRWIFGEYSPKVQLVGLILHKRPIEISVSWIGKRIGSQQDQPQYSLERDQFESPTFLIYPPWVKGPSSHTRISTLELDAGMGTRVRFIDPQSAHAKYDIHQHLRQHTLGYDMNVLDITAIRTKVRVLWQDGKISEHDSTGLLDETDTDDEHNAWPGEIAHSIETTTDEHGVMTACRVGVVQHVQASERMATIKWCPNACVQYSAVFDEDGKQLLQSVIGLASGDIEEVSLYDLETPAELNYSRGDMVLLHPCEEPSLQNVRGITWFGTVIDDRLDGTMTIRLCASVPVMDINLRREQLSLLLRFSDYNDEDEDDDFSHSTGLSSDMYSTDSDDDDISTDGVLSLRPIGDPIYQTEDGQILEDAEDDEWESAEDEEHEQAEDVVMSEAPAAAHLSAYTLHDSRVPADHHYRSSPVSTSTLRMRQIQKDHRFFQKDGAIPAGIYVHSWEERMDLWRVLFLGPEDTPYASAPFVVDFYLPTDYPQSAPQAFFHSWLGESSLGGAGKVNPNLYEDGTICLSLLGTWSGKAQESWNNKSTLLQVVVSILGLVLVKEPYFNEAGYEEQIGTEEAKRPSILYNERIVLRALNFAISAVAALQDGRVLSGLLALEAQLKWLYLSNDGAQLLQKLTQRVRTILDLSSSSSEADGLTTLSHGACISLRRVLLRLEDLGAIDTPATTC